MIKLLKMKPILTQLSICLLLKIFPLVESNEHHSKRTSPIAITLQHFLDYNGTTVIHFTCFDKESQLQAGQTKEDCCQKIMVATSQLCPSTENIESTHLPSDSCQKLKSRKEGNDELESLVQQQCHLHATMLPDFNVMQDNLEEAKPIMYFNLPLGNLIDTASADTNDSSKMELKQSQPDFNSNVSKLIQYNNRNEIWESYEIAKSPFQLETYSSCNSDGQRPRNELVVNLQSSVSKEGGMHRAYTHLISLSNKIPNFTDGASMPKLLETIGKVEFAMPLSEGVFLDMDDLFQLHGDTQQACRIYFHSKTYSNSGSDSDQDDYVAKCLVEVKTAPDTVIDIEQPAFVSPQHVIALQIDFQLGHHQFDQSSKDQRINTDGIQDSILDLDIDIEIVMNLHFRYPKTRALANFWFHAAFVPVHIVTPFLLSASVDTPSTMKKNTAHWNAFTYFALDRMRGIDDTTVNVAAGIDGHHVPVMVITLIVSLIGSWGMLRSMSTVSVWR